MNATRWRRVCEILDALIPLDAAARVAQLDDACAGDRELRAQIEALLRSHDSAGDFLQAPAQKLMAECFATLPPLQLTGRRLGVYEFLEEIGHGGMGEVYRAVRADGQYDQQVAIKMVRLGWNAPFAQERFRQERQILASLEHPYIARLYDGGTTDNGVPYLVEELIEGLPIDEYCDRHQLAVAARLELFQRVCEAVQYAHQRLVIHRDLKPSNILVTHEGVPKLIDFGIASIHDDRVPAQATQLRPMTLEYASPEHLRGTGVTTATDVYSLGVVLYELLVGRLPHSSKAVAPHELARMICESVPVRPSATLSEQPEDICRLRAATRARLRSLLRGDLDNIVMQALRKEPEHRYSSVERFAEDLRRLGAGLPVTATRGSWHYRASKFARRHWAGTIATTAALIAIMAGLAVALRETQLANRQAEVARQQRSLADRRFNELRKLANSMLFEVHDSIKDLPGSTLARKLLVTRAIEYLDSISAESQNDTLLLRDLVVAYQKIGDVQGQPRQANLGDVAGAELSYRKARELGERLVATEPGNLDLRRDLVKSYGKLSDLLAAKGDLAGAMEFSGKQMATAAAVYAADPQSIANRTLYAVYRMDHGYKQATLGGDLPRGLQNIQLGTALLEQLAVERPLDHYVHRILGLSYSRAAELQNTDPAGLQQSLELYRKALAVKKQLLAAEPNNADYQRLVAYDKFTIGSVLKQLGRHREAIALDREALTRFEELANADPASPLYRHDIAEARHDLGAMLVDTGVIAEAIKQLQLSLAALQGSKGTTESPEAADPIAASDLYWLGEAQVRAASRPEATAHQRREHCREAQLWFGRALPALQQALRHSVPDPVIAEQLHALQRDRQRCAKAPLSRAR